MSDLQNAIDVVNAGVAAEPAAAPDAPATPATDPSAPAAPPAAPAAPEPSQADDTAELLTVLEARKAARQSKQPGIDVSALQAQITALEARLAQPPAPAHPDFAALVREHGHVKAVEILGLDPFQHFAEFKEFAKNPGRLQAIKEKAELDARIKALEEGTNGTKQTLEQRAAAEKAAADAAQWRAYDQMVASPEMGTPLLAKLPTDERVAWTQRTIAALQQEYGPETCAEITDAQLAKLTEKKLRSWTDLLAGTDASATTTAKVPATDGATKPGSPASLTNDLASQSTGRDRPTTEKERLAAAIAIVEAGSRA